MTSTDCSSVEYFSSVFFPPVVEHIRDTVADNPMSGNAEQIWFPIAQGVLDGGELFVTHFDSGGSKPPLFEFINIFAAWTGHYRLTFAIFIGVANAVSAYLIYRLVTRHYSKQASYVAAFAYLGMIFTFTPSGPATINPRQFAVAFVVASFIARKAALRGVLIAAAGLLIQYSVFAIPILIYQDCAEGQFSPSRTLRFIVGGLVTVFVTFALVALIWSPSASIAGFRRSFLESAEYAQYYGQRQEAAWVNPDRWLFVTWQKFNSVLLFGVLLVFYGATDFLGNHGETLPRVSLLAAVALVLPTLIRPVTWYYVLPLPFVAIGGATGLERLLTRG